VNSIIKIKTGVGDNICEEDHLTNNEDEKAEALNKFLRSIFTIEDMNNILDDIPS